MEIIFKYMTDSQPSWFDWLSLFISIISIVIAYLWGRYIYKKEKKDRQNEEAENIKSEKQLFYDNLSYIQETIERQIEALDIYKKNLKPMLSPSLEIDFLKYINVKSLYKGNNRNNVNRLLSVLYQLYGFNNILMSNIISFRDIKYNEEKSFLDAHTQVFLHQLTRLRIERGFVENSGDNFMEGYMDIARIYQTNLYSFQDKMDNDVIFERLIELMQHIGKYADIDIGAQEAGVYVINSIAIYKRLKREREGHFLVIDNFIKYLKDRLEKIREYKLLIKYD